MRHLPPRPARRLALAALAGVALAGCKDTTTAPKVIAPPPQYEAMAPRVVPAWLKGSIMEQVNLWYTGPYRVSNFGVVVLPKASGGDVTNVPNGVREYILREMTKRNFGSSNQPGFEHLAPEQVFKDPHVAIVRVDAFIPPGAAKDQRIDAQVSVLADSENKSLAGGSLYTTDLTDNGANLLSPGDGVNVRANARGYVFVNPAFVLDARDDDKSQRRELTRGLLLNGARVNQPRPIGLRIRAAERRLSRMTEMRIDQAFADDKAAAAKDEGIVYVYMPAKYRGDWEHFAGVVLHTFYTADTSYVVAKSRLIASEIVKPNAPLLDLSYAIEALGIAALPAVEPLMTDPSPDVSFAVARAGAWLGDGPAEAALATIARDGNNPYHTTAVQTLAALPETPAIDAVLRDLLNVTDAAVRVEAYKGLVRNQDPVVFSKPIGDKFIIDIVESTGTPIVWAASSGTPRIAFIGPTTRVQQPAFLTAMRDEFSIADDNDHKNLLTLFYRGVAGDPVKQLTSPDLAEIVARLGGEGPAGQKMFNFSYGEIVALLGKFADTKMLVATNDRLTPANFILQTRPGADRDVNTAPIIPDDGPRPADAPVSEATPTQPQASSR